MCNSRFHTLLTPTSGLGGPLLYSRNENGVADDEMLYNDGANVLTDAFRVLRTQETIIQNERLRCVSRDYAFPELVRHFVALYEWIEMQN